MRFYIPRPTASDGFVKFLDDGARYAMYCHIDPLTHGRYCQVYRDYCELCTACREPCRFTYVTVSRYLFLVFVVPTRQKPLPSSSSVSNVLTSLRQVSKASHGALPWLSLHEEDQVKALQKGLAALDTSGATQAFGLVYSVILAMLPDIAAAQLLDIQWGVQALIMHFLMLRMDDIAAGKLRKCHFHCHDDGSFTVMVPPGKTHKTFQPAHIPASSLLAQWLSLYFEMLDFASSPDAAFFLPEVHQSGFIDWSRYSSKCDFIESVQARAAALGLPAASIARITGHSFRSGGCTDFILAGLSPAWIKQQGRWKSDAYLGYFRLTASSLAVQSQQMYGALLRSAASS